MTQQTVDLTNCDREPIHIPGSIQPHGCLLACDVGVRRVLRHSANLREMLDLPGDPNGADLSDVLGAALAHDIRNVVARVGEGERSGQMFDVAIGTRRYDIAVHRFRGHALIEIEPAGADLAATTEAARTVLGRLRSIDRVERVIQTAAPLLQSILGYDRVMIYELGQDGAGKVVAEAKRFDLESFRGQYFPATDIPQQARALYLRNTIRLISDARYAPVPLVPVLDESGEPLDLSHSHLRSVSPIHCEYLQNMGVSASMSISIIIDGELWGLIACHHYSPRILSMAARSAAEMLGEFFSLHLNALYRGQALRAATEARSALDRLLSSSVSTDLADTLHDRIADLAQMIPSDGAALWMGDRWSTWGKAPSQDVSEPLRKLAAEMATDKIWASNNLASVLPDAAGVLAAASGVIIMPLSQRPKDFLFYFRREVVQTLDWAGDPTKTYQTGPLGDRLTPRKSFAIWKETVLGKSTPWSDAERQFAEAVRISIVAAVLRSTEMLAEERTKAAVRQRLLSEELNHRVKNILAVIKALVSQPAKDDETLESYVDTLRGRIQALSVAHDQVVRGDGGGRLDELLSAELGPYHTSHTTVTLSGRPIWLEARAYSVMALVLHEMATNAAKYGSLSRRGGLVRVKWEVDAEGDCSLEWAEEGGPVVTPPQRHGFGTVLVDRSIPYDLGGRSDIDYAPTGVRAQLTIPSRFLRVPREPLAPLSRRPTTVPPGRMDLSGLRMLIVEDQMLIALNLETVLHEAKAEAVWVARSVVEARALIAGDRPDAAVLDINLSGETSYPIAQELLRRGTPFIFASGYGELASIPREFSHVPMVTKPYDTSDLMGALQVVLAGRSLKL